MRVTPPLFLCNLFLLFTLYRVRSKGICPSSFLSHKLPMLSNSISNIVNYVIQNLSLTQSPIPIKAHNSYSYTSYTTPTAPP
jgi:hypothetical protein